MTFSISTSPVGGGGGSRGRGKVGDAKYWIFWLLFFLKCYYLYINNKKTSHNSFLSLPVAIVKVQIVWLALACGGRGGDREKGGIDMLKD